MYRVFAGLHRAAIGGIRGSLREENQGIPRTRFLNVLQNGTGFSSLSCGCSVEPVSGKPSLICLQGPSRRSLPATPHLANSPLVLYSSKLKEDGYGCTGGRNLSEGDGKAGFSIDDWYHYTAALVLTYNIIHIQQDFKVPPECCPVLAIKNTRSASAQPISTTYHTQSEPFKRIVKFDEVLAAIENKYSSEPIRQKTETTSEVELAGKQSASNESLSIDEETDHKSKPNLKESLSRKEETDHKFKPDLKESLSRNNETDHKSKPRLSPVQAFQSDLDALDAVHLLQEGNPRGIYALKVESQKGSSVASFFLGMAFEQGYLVNKNLNTARIYYQRAADAGNPEAEFNLAVFYSKGWGGLAKSEEKSLALLHRAAEAGLVKAQNALGLDIKVDLEEGKRSARDLYMLGRSFEDLGEVGVALEMYKKAEKAGYSRAGRARVRLSSLSS